MPDRETVRPPEPPEPPEAAGTDPGATTKRVIEVKGDFPRQVPRVLLSKAEVNAADLDSRDYFLLSLLDGKTTIEELLDISGMPQEEAIAVLDDLVRRGLVGVP